MSDFDVWQRPLAGLQIGWSTGQVHALMTVGLVVVAEPKPPALHPEPPPRAARAGRGRRRVFGGGGGGEGSGSGEAGATQVSSFTTGQFVTTGLMSEVPIGRWQAARGQARGTSTFRRRARP